MKLSQFRYNLPQELIALYPSANRDESRLLIVNRKTGKFEHKIFRGIVSGLTKAFVIDKPTKENCLRTGR